MLFRSILAIEKRWFTKYATGWKVLLMVTLCLSIVFKVYWEDGCQVSAEVADGILACIERTDYFDGIRSADFAAALADNIFLNPVYKNVVG